MNLNWFESHGFLTPAGVMLMVKLWKWTRRSVRRALPALKRGAAAVALYVTLKMGYLYFRFFASKEDIQEAAKAVMVIALVYFIGKAMEENPKPDAAA